MKKFICIFISVLAGVFTSAAYGEIYSWTDENGVRNFSNLKPPRNEFIEAEKMIKIKEIPYDREADLNRMVSERLAREERRLDLLKQLQALAEKRLRDANRKAEAVIAVAEDLSREIEFTRAPQYEDAEAEDRDPYRVIFVPKYGYVHPRKGFRNRHPVLGIHSAPQFPKKAGPRYPNRKRQEYKRHMKQYYRKHGYINSKPRAQRRYPRRRTRIRE